MAQDRTDETARTVDSRDVMLGVGLLLLAVGSWFIWPPLCALAPGVVLIGIAVFGVR